LKREDRGRFAQNGEGILKGSEANSEKMVKKEGVRQYSDA